jgi:hypothetical protein
MVSEYQVSAADMIPPQVAQQWPESVPVHAITLIDGIRPDGKHALHAIQSEGTAPWVLIGMLRAVLADLEAQWAEAAWITEDDDEEDDDD